MLLDFYEKEARIKVERNEMWHNEENAKKIEKYDKGKCAGVPFFVNTDEIIDGELSYEELKTRAGVK